MSAGFQAVQWNRRKLVYDAILIGCVALFIGTFITVGALRNPPPDPPAWIGLRIKAFGTCAFVMLTIILMIGPLARLEPALSAAALQPPPFRRADVSRRAGARVFGGRLVRRAGRDGRPDERDDRQPAITAGSSASRSRRSACSASPSCSCSPPPAMISGSRSSHRASGRRCTWRSMSLMACW